MLNPVEPFGENHDRQCDREKRQACHTAEAPVSGK
jgi:hypothetical protein